MGIAAIAFVMASQFTGVGRSVAVDSPAVVDVGQAGMNMPSNSRARYSYSFHDDYIAEVKSIGATWITLAPSWFVESETASVVKPHDTWTASDASLLHAIQTASNLGLKVALKPLVAVEGWTVWRGKLAPSDLNQWFATYTKFINHYANLAESSGVDQFLVGTELASLSRYTGRWRNIIQSVRTTYTGPLGYGAMSGGEWKAIQFWDDLDFIGIQAYWPLAKQPTRDVDELVAAWSSIEAEIESMAVELARPVLFTEAGYRSVRGATVAPADWKSDGEVDEREQRAAYEALLRVFSDEPWFAGVHWWRWDDHPDRDEPAGFTPNGKLALDVLVKWWTPTPGGVGGANPAARSVMSLASDSGETSAVPAVLRSNSKTAAPVEPSDAPATAGATASDAGAADQRRLVADVTRLAAHLTVALLNLR